MSAVAGSAGAWVGFVGALVAGAGWAGLFWGLVAGCGWLGVLGALVASGGWVGLLWALRSLRRARRRLEAVARAEHELRGPVAVLVLTRERMLREAVGRRYARALEVELERLMAGLSDLTAARTGKRRPRAGGDFAGRDVAGRDPLGRTGARRSQAGGARGRSADLRSFADGALAGWSPALRAAGRRTRFDWKAGRVPLPRDRGRVAQALGNLVANAAEHGSGEVEVRGRRVPGGVRVEVRNGLAKERERDEEERGGVAKRGRDAQRGGEAERGRKAKRGREAERGRGIPIAVRAASDLGGTIVTDRGPRSFRAALELPVSEASLRLRDRLAAGAPRAPRPGTRSKSGPAVPPGSGKAARTKTGKAMPRGSGPIVRSKAVPSASGEAARSNSGSGPARTVGKAGRGSSGPVASRAARAAAPASKPTPASNPTAPPGSPRDLPRPSKPSRPGYPPWGPRGGGRVGPSRPPRPTPPPRRATGNRRRM